VDVVRRHPPLPPVGGQPALADRVDERQVPGLGLGAQALVEREQRRRHVVVHPERADDDEACIGVRHPQPVQRQPGGGQAHRHARPGVVAPAGDDDDVHVWRRGRAGPRGRRQRALRVGVVGVAVRLAAVRVPGAGFAVVAADPAHRPRGEAGEAALRPGAAAAGGVAVADEQRDRTPDRHGAGEPDAGRGAVQDVAGGRSRRGGAARHRAEPGRDDAAADERTCEQERDSSHGKGLGSRPAGRPGVVARRS
jgi:hypothetical protein